MKKPHNLKGLIIGLILPFMVFFAFYGKAQFPNQGGFINPEDSLLSLPMDSIPLEISKQTRENIVVFGKLNVYESRLFSDTSLIGFQYDLPDETNHSVFQTLGFPGSAGRSLFYKTQEKRGWQSGVNVYDHYLLSPEKTDFFKTQLPYANVRYTQRGTQANNHFNGILAVPFSNGVYANFRIVNLNHKGAYTNQQSKNNHFAFSLVQEKEDSPWKHFLGMHFNFLSFNENGGLVSDSLFDGGYNDIRTELPVFLDAARSKYNENHIYWESNYVVKAFEKSNFKPVITVGGQRTQKYYLFADTGEKNAEIYYHEFYTDRRGVRQLLDATVWKADIGLDAIVQRDGKNIKLFSGQLEYRNNQVNQDGSFRSTIQELFVIGQMSIPLAFAELSAEGWYKFPNGKPEDLFLKPRLGFDFNKFGKLSGGIVLRSRPPTQLDQLLVVTHRSVYENDFKSSLTSAVFGEYQVPQLKLQVEFLMQRIDNLIYFNSDFYPVQADFAVNSIGLKLNHAYQNKWMFFENTLVFQQSDDEILPLPDYWWRHSLGYTTKMFKQRFDLRIGYNMILSPSYHAMAYTPLIAGFYNQDEKVTGFYPQTDFFIAFKISDFRFCVNVENTSNFFLPGAAFSTILYPERDWQLSISIGWQLWN